MFESCCCAPRGTWHLAWVPLLPQACHLKSIPHSSTVLLVFLGQGSMPTPCCGFLQDTTCTVLTRAAPTCAPIASFSCLAGPVTRPQLQQHLEGEAHGRCAASSNRQDSGCTALTRTHALWRGTTALQKTMRPPWPHHGNVCRECQCHWWCSNHCMLGVGDVLVVFQFSRRVTPAVEYT